MRQVNGECPGRQPRDHGRGPRGARHDPRSRGRGISRDHRSARILDLWRIETAEALSDADFITARTRLLGSEAAGLLGPGARGELRALKRYSSEVPRCVARSWSAE